MWGAALLVWTLVAGFACFALLRRRAVHRLAFGKAVESLLPVMSRLPFAILAAAFLGRLLPQETVAALIGDSAGVSGILLASFIGGIMPGGPIVTFPLAIAIYNAGAGTAQMIALLTAWAVYALNRILAFELPMLGLRFVLFRFAVSLILPPLAGLLAALLQRQI